MNHINEQKLSLRYEEDCLMAGYKKVVGVDEVGIGCLAGPVVAGAFCLNIAHLDDLKRVNLISQVNDSKKLSEKQRNQVYDLLIQKDNFSAFGIGIASIDEIEKFNILNASYIAMQRALDNLQLNFKINYDFLLIDGKNIKNKNQFNVPFSTIISGDALSYSIACASIIAKVTRDNLMKDFAVQYPEYGWDKNAGYGTKSHLKAIDTHGITEYHRKSYAPVQQYLNRNNQLF